jgi:hypothetical protein
MHPKAPSIGIADAQPLVRERSLTAVLSRPKNKDAQNINPRHLRQELFRKAR